MKSKSGWTLLEFIVASLISSIALMAAASVLLNSVRQLSRDELIINARVNASMIYTKLTHDIRMAGSGMLISRNGNLSWENTNDSRSLPIVAGDEDSITLRVSQRDRQTVLTQPYTPDLNGDASGWTVSVLDTVDFSTGDLVYISGVTALQDLVLRGHIESIDNDAKTMQLHTTAGAGGIEAFWTVGTPTLPAGSLVSAVGIVTYQNSPDGIVIIDKNTPDEGYVLAPNSSFSLEFIDSGGSNISPPLTGSKIMGSDDTPWLQQVVVNLTVDSGRKLHHNDNSNFIVNITGKATPRNIVLSRRRS